MTKANKQAVETVLGALEPILRRVYRNGSWYYQTSVGLMSKEGLKAWLLKVLYND